MKYLIFTLMTFILTVMAKADGPGKNSLNDCRRLDDYSIECTIDKSSPRDSKEIKEAFKESGVVVPQERYELDQFHGITFPKGNKEEIEQDLHYELKSK